MLLEVSGFSMKVLDKSSEQEAILRLRFLMAALEGAYDSS